MIYLVLQMLFSIALALIAGGAIGWLMHRRRSSGQYELLQHKLAHQSQQLNHAHAEVTMLTDDFEEMKQRSQAELDVLRHENRQLPMLSQNLEKSQLLVRQMMQRHEAQIRDISTENDVLSQRLRTASEREQSLQKGQANPENERSNNSSSDQAEGKTVDDTATNSTTDKQGALPLNLPAADKSGGGLTDATPPANRSVLAKDNSSDAQDMPVASSADSSSWASVPVASGATTSAIESAVNNVTPNNANEDEDDPFDKVIEINDELHAEIVNDVDNQSEDDANQAEEAIGPTTPSSTNIRKGRRWQDREKRQAESHGNSQPVEAESDEEPLFDPVDQRDDLKQIFGIGPVTEKALNQLGITSYSQLADLKRHDIESIADALQIFPGRIERDNWVGNARRQLEEVLEEL